ncbi:hypothetical protein [Rhizobium leguminosarum]|uniref:hypothetical protein n=1 Tax=Rhizobium leguminosarum TaxID=384 RepID=UPI001FE0A95F|nr:hypothetical protein [Rhizobium leguminosarum]
MPFFKRRVVHAVRVPECFPAALALPELLAWRPVFFTDGPAAIDERKDDDVAGSIRFDGSATVGAGDGLTRIGSGKNGDLWIDLPVLECQCARRAENVGQGNRLHGSRNGDS